MKKYVFLLLLCAGCSTADTDRDFEKLQENINSTWCTIESVDCLLEVSDSLTTKEGKEKFRNLIQNELHLLKTHVITKEEVVLFLDKYTKACAIKKAKLEHNGLDCSKYLK